MGSFSMESMDFQDYLRNRVKGEPVVLYEVMLSDDEYQEEEEDTLNAPNDHHLDANHLEEEAVDEAKVEHESNQTSETVEPPAPSNSGRQPVENVDGDDDRKEKPRQRNILLNQQRSELKLLKTNYNKLRDAYSKLIVIAEWEFDNAMDMCVYEHRMRLEAESELQRLKQKQEQPGTSSRNGEDRAQVNPVAVNDNIEDEAVRAVRSSANVSVPGPSGSSLPFRRFPFTFKERMARNLALLSRAGNLDRQPAGPSPASNVRSENAGAAPGPSQPIPQKRTEGVPSPNSRPVPVVNTPPGVRSTRPVQTARPSTSFPRQQSVISPSVPGPSRSMNQISVGPSTNAVGDDAMNISQTSTLRQQSEGIHDVQDKTLDGIRCSSCAMIFENRKEHMRHRVAVHGTRVGSKSHKRARRTTSRPSTSSSATTGTSAPSLGRGSRIRQLPARLAGYELPQPSTRNAAMRTQPTRNERAISRPGFVHESHGHTLIGPDPKHRSAVYQCECGLTFYRRATFRVHLQFKKYGKIFNCYNCDKDFICLSVLKTHLNNIHEQAYDQKSFKCGICKEKVSPKMLIEHRQNVHGIF